MIYIVFISILLGSYLPNKPIISLILGFFLFFLIRKNYSKKMVILSMFIISFFLLRTIIYKINLFTNYGIVVSSKSNYFIFYNGFSKYYVSSLEHSYEVFDIVYIVGKVKDYGFTTYESQFDFNNYLKNSFVFKEIESDKIEVIFSFPIRMKQIYENHINKYSIEGKTVVSELLFSKSYLKEYDNFINDFSLSYLLVISSLHMYYLNYLLRTILETKIKEKTVDKILIILDFWFIILSNFKLSIIRYFIYQLVTYIDKKKKLDLTYMKKIIISLICIGIIDNSYFYSNSFIYNISIPLHFFLISNAISTFKKKNQNIIRMCLLYVLLTLISVILNESFSILTILLVPIFSLIIMIIFILSFLTFLFPFQNIVSFLSRGLLIIFSYINKVDDKFFISNKNILFIILILTSLFVFILSSENKRKLYQKFSVFLLIYSFVLCKLPINNYFQSRVYFINVGQGDSILISHYNTNILIDTGGINSFDISQETLIPFFRKHNIYYLDYVFLSHQDYDHVGGFNSLKENFCIKDYNSNNNFTYININSIEIFNLNPSESNSENEESLVLYLTLNNTSYLLTGDIPISIEKKIVSKYPKLQIDVLKVAHHGSNTSTGEELLKNYDIKTAIISCGRNNYYNHPSTEVIDRLEKHHIEIRRTDKEGTIMIKN